MTRESTVTLDAVRGVVDDAAAGEPLTASEVADALDCARRTAYGKLETLADDDELATKKVGARGRVWWRPANAESAVALEGAQFRELVDVVRDYAIFVLDAKGRVQTWNEGARELKGYEESEIVGEHFSRFYTESDRLEGRPARNLEYARRDGRVEDEGWRVRKDGTRFWANVTITALRDDDDELRGYMKVTRDMTERHEYEERLREQRDELDELDAINTVIREIDQGLVAATSRSEVDRVVTDRLAASAAYTAAVSVTYDDARETVTLQASAGVDESGLEALFEPTGEGSARAAGAAALDTRRVRAVDRPGSPEDAIAAGVAVPIVHDDVPYGVLFVYAADDSAFDARKTAVLDELAETAGHAVAAVHREERERTLTALQRSTHELLRAESPAEIGDVVVETLTGELRLDDAAVYTFAAESNALEVASASAGTPAVGRVAARAESPIWSAFVNGETVVAESDPPDEAGPWPTVVVPLGDHGVLAVAATAGTVDANTRSLVSLVAATAEAVLDRVETQANLRERDELLREQNERLGRLNQINTIIRDVDQGVVQAQTRAEIERVVADRLAHGDHFQFAWLGTPTGDGDSLQAVASSGADRGYLAAVDLSIDGVTEAAEPAVSAFHTGEPVVVSNVAADLRGGDWRRAAFQREFQAVVAVPLAYGDVTYGVLAVYADRSGVFDDTDESVFAELGETVANAIDAVETKRALLSDDRVDLEFRLDDPTESLLGVLAGRLDCELSYEGVVPGGDERARLFFVARDADETAVRDALGALDAVESSRVLGAAGNGVLVEAAVAGASLLSAFSEHGASLRSLTATPEAVTLTADLPAGADVREFVEWMTATYGSAEFVARHDRERPGSRESVLAEVDDALTDRQLEVLRTAYYAGFFATPRRSTGSDVADLLDVSQPTVSEQLRTAQRKLLDVLLGN